MKSILYSMFGALALSSALLGSVAHAQEGDKPAKPAPAPIVIRFNAHAMKANDFQVRRSKDRSLEAEIKNKGMDVAYTEWMQPYVSQ